VARGFKFGPAAVKAAVLLPTKGETEMKDLMMEQYIKFTSRLASLLKREEGQTLVEYALLLALIAIVLITILSYVASTTCSVYSKVGSALS
jgi:pilus assembly protein Flp/PilA